MFKKQICLKNFGQSAQLKLTQSKVIIVGLGGLGSSACLYLCAAGVGTIGLVDGDHVSLSNLHRQIIHFQTDIDTKKVDSAQNKCININPNVIINKYPFFIDNSHSDIINQYDVILDCSDNASTRITLNSFAKKLKKPLVFGSAIGFDGQLCVFSPNRDLCLKCIFPNIEETTDSCDGMGVLGPVPGLIGILQAIECIKIITEVGKVQEGFLLYNALYNEFRTIQFDEEDKCECDNDSLDSCLRVQESPLFIQSNELEIEFDKISQYKSKLIIDIRKEESEDEIHSAIKETNVNKIKEMCNEITSSREEIVLIVCSIGVESLDLVKKFRKEGLENCYSIKGGFREIFK
jgi:molybdopterin/thiamine biosynthesis adenylyltransferase/rhodanese-related sulfurtransferase